MARYYDLDKLSKMIEAKADTMLEGKGAMLYVAKWLNLLPTADVVEVKRGYWKLTKTEFGWNGCEYPTEYTCTVCGGISPCCEESYCPNCGARMDGGKVV